MHPPTIISLYPPHILPRKDSIPALNSAKPLCNRLCFIRFMYTHPTPDKDKDKDKYKEEDNGDDLTLLINSSKFDIGRVTEVGSLGVGK